MMSDHEDALDSWTTAFLTDVTNWDWALDRLTLTNAPGPNALRLRCARQEMDEPAAGWDAAHAALTVWAKQQVET